MTVATVRAPARLLMTLPLPPGLSPTSAATRLANCGVVEGMHVIPLQVIGSHMVTLALPPTVAKRLVALAATVDTFVIPTVACSSDGNFQVEVASCATTEEGAQLTSGALCDLLSALGA